jgi:hypothetical protein
MGVGRVNALIRYPWGILIRNTVFSGPKLLQGSPQPRKQTSPFPLCASAPLREFSLIRSHSAFSYAPKGFSDDL